MRVAIGLALLTGTLSLSVFSVFAQPSRNVSNLPSCVNGDCNCDDFGTWQEAQRVLDAYQGDPFRLDTDLDGIACENLTGAPPYNSTPRSTYRPPSGSTNAPGSNRGDTNSPNPNSPNSNSPNSNPPRNTQPIRALW
ncbi:excalibur calcium-binding domain-containing protein [Oscillatoriales cyanobacterium LEGE 11467]|uniref:Excalibur calcium-binding domain-containing protein n=1 Tax=Zarconia navalis LEGE 11467 TaxID=1828826 RepID=A0A928ZAF5_9CYAN|nr:excalibur calcium-binding domain-containing protein [Zarconia navalis]MBE9041651.1 excalibur calcium-binding domain-containing protein [Zarconia navalis LEGE 11467]